MVCIVDEKETGEVYKNCCIDYGKHDDCGVAIQLVSDGKSKIDCKHWKNEELAFSVIAGKFDDNGMNCKYASDFFSLEEAIKAYDEMNGYPWRYIQYAGRVIDVYPEEFKPFG